MKKIKINRTLILHPVLLAIYPPLFILSYNMELITKADIPRILIAITIAFTLALLLWFLGKLILKDGEKSALIISLGLILFFSYGHFASLAAGLWRTVVIGDFVIGPHKGFLTIWGVIFLLGAYFLFRLRRNLNIVTKLLNVIAATLVAIALINIGAQAFRGGSTYWDNEISPPKTQGSTSSVNISRSFPDVYYIILDAYASSSTLVDVYNYDNNEFYDYLTQKGFYIASESHSNYAQTFLSLASSLNMDYLDKLAETEGVESKNHEVAFQMIKNNKLMNLLKSKGYKSIHVSSGWGPTQDNEYADLNIMSGRFNEYLNVLVQTTMAGPVMANIFKEDQAQIVLDAFSQLAELPEVSGPKFVFAHINSPHPPAVFGANGEPVPESKFAMEGRVWEERELYLNQLIFITKKVEKLVGDLLLKSEVPPIIVLQSDHGTAATFYAEGKEYFDSPTKDMLRERFSIFNAYYLPGNGEEIVYSSITPVNTFRQIMNFYFGTNYDLLGDYSYYSTYEQPYELFDVTDEVRN